MATEAGRPGAGLALGFTLRPGRWVDLDTLVETTMAGLRDAGCYRRGLVDLDVLIATKRSGAPTGVAVEAHDPDWLRAVPSPGRSLLDVGAEQVPRDLDGKRTWREQLGRAWDRPLLDGPVWAEVSFSKRGSLLGALEPVLDALEPVLGRDPRSQPRQEFFPRDDRLVWLRVARADGAAVRLRLGPSDPRQV